MEPNAPTPIPEPERIEAPFDQETVRLVNVSQGHGDGPPVGHPDTCRTCGSSLFAKTKGLVCQRATCRDLNAVQKTDVLAAAVELARQRDGEPTTPVASDDFDSAWLPHGSALAQLVDAMGATSFHATLTGDDGTAAFLTLETELSPRALAAVQRDHREREARLDVLTDAATSVAPLPRGYALDAPPPVRYHNDEAGWNGVPRTGWDEGDLRAVTSGGVFAALATLHAYGGWEHDGPRPYHHVLYVDGPYLSDGHVRVDLAKGLLAEARRRAIAAGFRAVTCTPSTPEAVEAAVELGFLLVNQPSSTSSTGSFLCPL